MGSTGDYLDNESSLDRHRGKKGGTIDNDANLEWYGGISAATKPMRPVIRNVLERVFPTQY